MRIVKPILKPQKKSTKLHTNWNFQVLIYVFHSQHLICIILIFCDFYIIQVGLKATVKEPINSVNTTLTAVHRCVCWREKFHGEHNQDINIKKWDRTIKRTNTKNHEIEKKKENASIKKYRWNIQQSTLLYVGRWVISSIQSSKIER